MSSIVPIARTVVKKVTPKTKKGKVAAAGAAAFGIGMANRDNSKPATTTALAPSQDAQNQNAPQTSGTGGKTLLGLEPGTPVRAGVSSGFAGVPYRLDYRGPTYTTADQVKGAAENYFATKSAPQKAALLLRLGQIPGLYSRGQEPTSAYVSTMGNRIVWRDQDAKALEQVIYYQDQLGDATPDVTISNLISNPSFSAKLFGKVSGAGAAVSSPAALEAELNDKFLDIFETTADKNIAKAYAKEVNALEAKGGASTQQKEDILLKYIQKKANEQFNIGQTGMVPGVADKGALGRRVRTLRAAYDDNGIPIDERQVYNKAVQTLRSQEAYQNEIDSVTMQASLVMPAFKDFFAQGKTARQILSPWINTRAQVLGIPADQIKVSDMYDIGSGTAPKSIQDYKKELYRSPEFKKTDAYKERSLGDFQALLKAFNIG
jgi:hypothetical protein